MAVNSKNTPKEGGDQTSTQPPPSLKVCGIVMPIAAMGDEYSEEHWRRVRKILQRAIEKAGMRPQLVWENPEVDVIQSAILQNLYENDVVICDVSALNANVMLETGLRLSTKRPTIIVTDRLVKPPFDVSTIGYIDYQHDLEFNAIDNFIERLSTKITNVLEAQEKQTYVSFVENYTFETVTPSTVAVPEAEYLREKFEELASSMGRLERILRMERNSKPVVTKRSTSSNTPTSDSNERRLCGAFKIEVTEDTATMIENAIDKLDDVFCIVDDNGDGHYEFKIFRMKGCSIPVGVIMRSVDNLVSSML